MNFLGLHIGWRTTKTAIAIFICIVIYLFIFNDNPMLASLAAAFTIRQDLSESLDYGQARVFGILLSGIITIVTITFLPIQAANDPILLIIVPFSTTFFITIASKLKLNRGIIAGISTMLIIYFNIPLEQQINYAITRVFATMIGVGVGIVVNQIFPHKNK